MHWRHSDFQIRHFIAAKAHTPDEAYRLVKQELENREIALALAKASGLRQEALSLRAQAEKRRYADPDTPGNLDASATLLEIEATRRQSDACIEACRHEIVVLGALLEEILPECRFVGHMPEAEAFQLAQSEEWLRELIHRAQVMIASSGFIPWDHLETMTLHPAWEESILPEITLARQRLIMTPHQESLLKKEVPYVGQANSLS